MAITVDPIKISELPDGTDGTGAELFEAVQGGDSVKLTLAQIRAFILSQSNTFVGAQVITTTGANTSLTLVSTDSGNNAGPNLDLFRDSSSPAVNDALSRINWYGRDDGGALQTYASITPYISNPAVGAEAGLLQFNTAVAGAVASRLNLAAGMWMAGTTGSDKGIGSFNAQTLWQNNVQVATLGVNTFAGNQQINGTTLTPLTVSWADNGATQGPYLVIDRNSNSPAAADVTGGIIFQGRNSSAATQDYVRIGTTIATPTAGAEDGTFNVQTRRAGTNNFRFNIGSGAWMQGATGTDMGAGTFNATGLFDDSSPVTCMAAAREYRETGTIDVDFWDNQIPPLVIPEFKEQIPVMETVEIEEIENVKITRGTNKGAFRRRTVTKTVERQKCIETPVLDEKGNVVDVVIEPVFEIVTTPAQVIRRQHRTARIIKAMCDSGFDPRDPEQYFERWTADEAIPGMPTRCDGPVKWVHNSLSIGEQHSLAWLAQEMHVIISHAIYQRLKDVEARLAALEAGQGAA